MSAWRRDTTALPVHWRELTAFDYAPEGVDRARALFGSRSVDVRVADARALPFGIGSFDAVLDKGTLDAVFLAGEDELVRAVAPARGARVVHRSPVRDADGAARW